MRFGKTLRLPRRPLPAILASLAVFSTAGGAHPAEAATWRSLVPDGSAGRLELRIESRLLTYYVLDAQEPLRLNVTGPRRVKIISRHVATPQTEEGDYELRVAVDGQEVLARSLTPRRHRGLAVEGEPALSVSYLQRSYVEVGPGRHELEIRGGSEHGRAAVRVFQRVRSRRVEMVAYAPESFAAVTHLQFASGSQTTYYRFDEQNPLVLKLRGPTNVQLDVRLDFTHTMQGRQNFTLEITCDGEPWKLYHGEAGKLASAEYVEHPEILPGTRSRLRLPVPAGPHNLTGRCLRPAGCGAAARARIPLADLRAD